MNYNLLESARSPLLVAALLLALAATAVSSLRAQTYSDVTITNSLTVNGVVIGPANSAVTLPSAALSTGSSYKSGLLWHPGKMALLIGTFPTSESSIGTYSISLNGTASGSSSFATAGGSASGSNSFASGMGYASGGNSFASGEFATASGFDSVAMGLFAQAIGSCSNAIGIATRASGANSTALGLGTLAGSLDSCAVGAYNIGSFKDNNDGNPNNDGDTQWISTDPIFEVGNGNYSARSNALTVYKNGNVAVQGVLTVAPSSDIPMYTGN
jgi:hypothetical protein